jgi:hypothetical protein
MSARSYDAAFIYPLLKKTLYCSFATLKARDIHGRFLMFACSDDLQAFYFLTPGSTEKVKELQAHPQATLCILSTSDKLDDYAETIVIGDAELLKDFGHPGVQTGLARLAEKSGQVQGLVASGSLGDYQLIRLVSREIHFRVYQDVISNVPKTVLRY